MNIAIKIERPGIAVSEVRDVVSYALRNETEQARTRRDYFAETCRTFETQYNIPSDEFLERFDRGELGDDVYMFDWYAAKRGLDLWERRYQVLREVSV